MTKTILFVTYGGGHATMVAPVIRALSSCADIKTQTLALTLGGPYFSRQNMPYMGFKDFITPQDTDALIWGKKLAALYHQPQTGIEEAEAVAYLGLSYWDLVTRYGEAEAARLWEDKQRNAFFPISILERVLDRVQPDMVVTTNSPRAEYAAQVAANKRGIPTLSMYDLFGLFNFYQIQADYLAVISDLVVDNLRKDTGLREGQQFLITGNPAFDLALDYRGPVNMAWRREHFPTLPEGAKVLLDIDEPAYFDRDTNTWHYRTDEEVWENLDQLAHAAQCNNGYLLIRPHPSQPRAPFFTWMEKNAHPHVLFAGDVPLYPLLNASDAVVLLSSTVGCEALLVGRPVIQMDYFPALNTILLGEWGVAHWLKTPDRMVETVRQCFYEPSPDYMEARTNQLFPEGKSAPKVAAAIQSILFKTQA
jgi:hypothetical protein